jgi:hypothetical protein
MVSKFDNQIADAQATQVLPVKPGNFDFDKYEAYTAELNKTCARFWEQKSGVVVYRRCGWRVFLVWLPRYETYHLSYRWALWRKVCFSKPMCPIFWNPGMCSERCQRMGRRYLWTEGNAPALKAPFKTIDEVLAYPPTEIAKTNIGRHTLDMIEYFMDQTKGRVPVSLTDTQSPLNMIGHLYPLDQFFMDMLLEPEKVLQLFDRLADLSINFNNEQIKLIGDALASPGNGFAVIDQMVGLGMSDDNAIMISPDTISGNAAPSVKKYALRWEARFSIRVAMVGLVDAVLQIKGH